MRVFVSSTFTDLTQYRTSVTRAILAAGDIPDDMLYWPAEENRPLEVCLRRLHSSDVIILILAHRYGFIPSGYNKSVTEIEFDTAISSGKPVLAFCVDENHPWPPSFLERDESAFEKLKTFHGKVKGALTIRFFTTPESLEAGVSQAVAHYKSESLERTGKGWLDTDAQFIHRRERLLYAPNSLVLIGRAPDGAPLLLDVKREVVLSSNIDVIANRIGKQLDDPFIIDMQKGVAFHAKAFSLSRGVREATFGDKAVAVYSSDTPIGTLLGPNLLQTLSSSAARGDTRKFGSYSEAPITSWARESTRRSGIESRAGLDARVTSVGGANRFLCLSIDDEKEVWTGGLDSNKFVLWRCFMEESLQIFRAVQYYIFCQTDGRSRRLTKADNPAEHHSQWKEILSARRPQNNSILFHEIRVPRHSYVETLLGVVRAVATLHEEQFIHGDLKPSNVLITARGVELIDEIGLSPGEVAPTVTVGWSPPEQLCRQPLLFTADVFSLGLLFVRGLGCELLGREVRVRLPGDLEAHAMDDPSVYLDPADGSLPFSARKSWLDVLERCLRSEPRQRWSTASDFADAVDELLSAHKIEGTISMRFPWSATPFLVNTGQDEVASAWILPDQWK